MIYLLLVPPDSDFINDEEEGNDAVFISLTLPKDMPETNEEIPRRPYHDILDWDNSQDELLSYYFRPSKRARCGLRRRDVSSL